MLNISQYKHIHCIGIGGIGLSAVAEIFASRGYTVSGSDMKMSEMTEHLQSRGITVYEGHSAENIKCADLIVYIRCGLSGKSGNHSSAEKRVYRR